MRYFDVPVVTFNDANNRVTQVRDLRPIPTQVIDFEIPIKEQDLLDEIASRESIFGPGAEPQSYRIFDANIVELFDAEFDLTRIRRLRIPV